MIHNFLTVGTEDIFNGNNTKPARKTLPSSLWSVAARKLDQLDSIQSLEELKVPPGNRLELLFGDRSGQWSIRINDQFRICFRWEEQRPNDVVIIDYH
jgi:proteic killer suppression protein